ncbi:MAG TPA: exodeoxyribonuclease V subunit alpha [Polyangiaceae bacterium]|nr:exodeoxyribonuclease V subunit alpha [Polyangiaceae bacterium]
MTSFDLLERFVEHGVLSVFDRELALALGEMGGEGSETVLLAAAFASAAVQAGHTCVDLRKLAERTFTNADGESLGELALPAADAWKRELAESPLVMAADTASEARPLVFDARGRLYLKRYFDYEAALAAALVARHAPPPEALEPVALARSIERLFPAADTRGALQRVAALVFLRRRLTVISGGPGTGKTYTVAKALVLLQEQALAAGRPLHRILLTAPTGKAAQRLGDAIRDTLAKLELEPGPLAIPTQASTLHRALGFQASKPTRFRRDARHPLPDDVVVVDEASMVDLALMTKLVLAVRPEARLLLLGDKDQLASVEAGAILADIYAGAGQGVSRELARQIGDFAGMRLPEASGHGEPGLHDGMVHLTESHRFDDDGGIAARARAVNAGDPAAVLEVLARGGGVSLVPVADRQELERVLGPLVAAGLGELREGSPAERLARLDRFRVLAAHRRGPFGVAGLNAFAAAELGRRGRLEPRGSFYDGRPVIVVANDYDSGLFNGDVGVLASPAEGAPTRAWFRGETPGILRDLSPARLPQHETAFALSVHKSQGSEFAEVVFVLPERPSPVLTRELVYTAVTRARKKVTILGSESVLRVAVTTRVERASGLADRLWGVGGG